MSAPLTEEEFSQHLNTKFQVQIDDQQEVDLELTQVKQYFPRDSDHAGMERFSVFFAGPPNKCLPQRAYRFKHDQMGEFEIFLVPISGDANGFRYEAVFNYFKNKSEPPAVAGG
jgi:hypothetical protein